MRYSLGMKVGAISLVAFASIAMLSMQMSGLHLHAGKQSTDTAVHGAHIHDADPDGDDHSADIDVSVIDFGTVWSKVMPFLVAILPAALTVIWVFHSLWPPVVALIPPRRQSRWRPPLRAPPLSP